MMPLNSAQSISTGAQYMLSTPALKMLDEMQQSVIFSGSIRRFPMTLEKSTSLKAYSNKWSQIVFIDCSLSVFG